MPVQGAASDLDMLAAIEMRRQGFDVILLIHDSVIVEVDEEGAECKAIEIAKIMEQTGKKYFPQIPWKADFEIKKRWGEPPSFSLKEE